MFLKMSCTKARGACHFASAVLLFILMGAGAQKARRRGVPATTGPAPSAPTSAGTEAPITDATAPKEPEQSATTGPGVAKPTRRRGKAGQ